MSSLPADMVLAVVLIVIPGLCLSLAGIYLNWHSRQIYKRIGNYSIGTFTFLLQLQQPGVNFPGPNVLESQIAAQPAELRDYIKVVRRRLRLFRRVGLYYLGFLFVAVAVLSVKRKLGH
jgi:hypothetical protein